MRLAQIVVLATTYGFSATAVTAQGIRLESVTVLDAVSGGPLEGATVSLGSGGPTLATDSVGVAMLTPDLPAPVRLSITHPTAQPIFLNWPPGSAVRALRVRMRPTADFVAVSPEHEDVRARATELARSNGARIWRREQFASFLGVVSHPLDLLSFSGLVWQVQGQGETRCLVVVADDPCARVSVHGESPDNAPFRAIFPAQFDSFVILPVVEGDSLRRLPRLVAFLIPSE